MKLHQKFFWLLVFFLPVQLGRHFWPKFSFVLGLKIDYLSPTFYLTDLLVLLVLFFWLWELFKKPKKKKLNWSWLGGNWWLLAFFLFFLANAFLAKNQGAAFYKLGKLIELAALSFYVARHKIKLSFWWLPLVLGMFYSSLLAIAQFLNQSSLNGFFWWLGERTFEMTTPGIAKVILQGQLFLRPYATFSHPNALAGFLLVGLILTSAFFFKKNKRWFSFWLALVLLGLALTFSRSAWLGGLIIGAWFLFQNPNQKKKFWFLVVLALMAFLFYRFASFSTTEAFFQRTQLMKSAWLMIKEAPFSGVGLNNFVVSLPNYWSSIGFTYWLQPVHNLFLLIASETGLVGLLISLWFFFLTFCRALTPKKNSIPFLIALVMILFLGLTDHYWLMLQQNQLLFSLVVGTIWSSQN